MPALSQLLATILTALLATESIQAQSSTTPPYQSTQVFATANFQTIQINPVLPAPIISNVAPTDPTLLLKPTVDNLLIPAVGQNGLLCPVSYNSIIQDCSLRNTPFEKNQVAVYLGIHGIPQSDSPVLYSNATIDLRNAIRAYMFNYLVSTILTDPAKRSSSDQNLYNWLSNAVKQQEIKYYQAFAAEYRKWQSDPCHFQLNPTIATALQITYNGFSACGASIGGVFQTVGPPDVSYFKLVAQSETYDQGVIRAATQLNPNLQATGAQMAAQVTLGAERKLSQAQAGASFGATIPLAAGTAALVAGNIAQIAPYLSRVPALLTASQAAEYEEVAAAVGAADVVGAAAIVLVFAQIGAQAVINLVATDSNQNAINAALSYSANVAPPLANMLQDQTGFQKIFETFIAATLPDVGPQFVTPVTPSQPSNQHTFFTIQDNIPGANGKPEGSSASFQYTSNDPSWPTYPASMAGTFDVSIYGNGWLFQSNAGRAFGTDPTLRLFGNTIEYTDYTNNINYIAEYINPGRWLISKDPAMLKIGDIPCVADPQYGITVYDVRKHSPPTNCSSFLTNNLNVEVFGSVGYFNNITNPQPPVFLSPSTLNFAVGQGRAYSPKLDATTLYYPLGEYLGGPPHFGAPIDRCTFSVPGSLPAGIFFLNNGTASGYFAGAPQAASPSSATASLVATCDGVSTTQQLTINIAGGSNPPAAVAHNAGLEPSSIIKASALTKTHPDATTGGLYFAFPTASTTLSLTIGRPYQIQVSTGGGVASLTAGANALPPGMSFKDNGDGTATINGSPTGPVSACTTGCGIIASAPNATPVTLTLNYNLVTPDVPSLPTTQTAIWPAGQSNAISFDGSMVASGKPTNVPLTWAVLSGLPTWATFASQVNNTASISGTPPVSAYNQTFPILVQYSYGGGTPKNITQYIQVSAPAPVLVVAPRLLFQVGVSGSGAVLSSTTSGGPGLPGAFKVNGNLPTGLTYLQNGTSLTISGTPTGAGVYQVPIAFTDNAGSTTSRNVELMITQPANLDSLPADVVLYTGIPANLTLPISAGYPVETFNSPGDGLPGSLGAGLTLSGFNDPYNGITVTAKNGALVISGTPLRAMAYSLSLSAQPALQDTTLIETDAGETVTKMKIPVGNVANHSFTLRVISSPGTCNGTTIGTYSGNITVSKDQICQINGGTVRGNLISDGGILILNNATITGNLKIGGPTTPTPTPLPIQVCGSKISGDLKIQQVVNPTTIGGASGSSCPPNIIAGNLQVIEGSGSVNLSYNTVKGNLQAQSLTTLLIASNNTVSGDMQLHDNSAPVNATANLVSGNLQAENNSESVQLLGNTIGKSLQCEKNFLISSVNNTSRSTEGQCAPNSGDDEREADLKTTRFAGH